MAPDHLVRLVERHEISQLVPRDMTDEQRARVWSVCEQQAQRWADDEQLAIDLHHIDSHVDRTCGVWWQVVVGSAHPAPTPNVYGTQHVWVWSARWLHWAAWFRSMQARDRAEERAALGRDETVVHGPWHTAGGRTVPDDRPLIPDTLRSAGPWDQDRAPGYLPGTRAENIRPL